MSSNAARKAQWESGKKSSDHGQNTPADILTWTNETRTAALSEWAGAVRTKITAPTAVLVAWAIEGLFVERGFAFPTDATIAKRIGRSVSAAKSGLEILEHCGAIRRSFAMNGKKWQRQIYPAEAIMRAPTPVRKVAPKLAKQPDGQATHQPDGQATEIITEITVDQTEFNRTPEPSSGGRILAIGEATGVATVIASSRDKIPNESVDGPDLTTREGRLLARKETREDYENMTPAERETEGLRRQAENEERDRQRVEAQRACERRESAEQHEIWKMLNADWLADEFDWRLVAKESAFWASWKTKKQQMIADGYGVRPAGDGGWQVRRRRTRRVAA